MVKAGPPKRRMVIAAVSAGGSRRTTLAGAGAECGHYLGQRGDGLVAEHGEDRIGGHRSAKGQTGPVQFTPEWCTEYLTATVCGGRSPSTGRRPNWGNFYRGVEHLADGVPPAPGPVTNAAHRSISPRRWSNRSLRA